MSRCPVCQSVRVVLVLSPRRKSFCASCGARWVQDGSEQKGVVFPERPAPPLLPVSDQPA